MRLPPFLHHFRSRPAPETPATGNPGRELALIGAARREAERKAASRAFHRAMRARLGLSAVPEFEER